MFRQRGYTSGEYWYSSSIRRNAMDRHKIIRKGVFQSANSFEEKVNAMAADGWKAVNLSSNNSCMYVLMKRDR